MEKEDWDKGAEHYSENHTGVKEVWAFLSQVTRDLKVETPVILDVCCGPGYLAREMYTQMPNAKIEGVDYSERMIDRARKECPFANFHVEDVRQIKLPKTRYDLVLWSGGMPYLDQTESLELLTKCNKSLQKEGILFLTTMTQKDGVGGEIISRGDLHIYSLQEVCSILRDSGFDALKSMVIKQKSTPKREDEVLMIMAKRRI